MGEPAGIGGEIALKAWRNRQSLLPFFLVDDPGRLTRLAQHLGWAVPIIEIAAPDEAAGAFSRGLPVLPEALPAEVMPGRPTAPTAPAVISAIRRAVDLAKSGKVGAIVTNPINK